MFFSNKYPSDETIIQGIRVGGTLRRQSENHLYEKFSYFIKEGVKKHTIDQEDSATAYSDTVLTVIDHIVSNRFEGRSSLKSYLFQIFSNKCVDVIRKKTTHKAASQYDTILLKEIMYPLSDSAQTIIQQIIEEESRQQLIERINLIGEKCKKLLLAWCDGYSDKEIALQLQYSSQEVVKTSRMRCINKLKEIYR